MSLIVLEGTDGSGKSTQMDLLKKALTAQGVDFRLLDFPRYAKPSGVLPKMYLDGDFGVSAGDVNSYAASVFFSVDRLASYLESCGWREDYNRGRLILADRYTTSNAIYQAAKLEPKERPAFFEWMFDFEYQKLQLPRPALTVLLDMPEDCAKQLRQSRGSIVDVHEIDSDFQTRCRETSLLAAELYDWKVVYCADWGKVRSIDAIHQEVMSIIKDAAR